MCEWVMVISVLIISCIVHSIFLYLVPFSPVVSAGLLCHPQCDSLTSCWGPKDTQCDGCRHFAFGNRCVQNCSNKFTGLITSDPGVYQNDGTGVCEPCHAQCVGGCSNGTVSKSNTSSSILGKIYCQMYVYTK